MKIEVTDCFKRSAKRLGKKYRHLFLELETLKQVLSANPQAGEAIPGFYNRVWKIRMASSDMGKGKSGGFRVIYYYIILGDSLYLLDIYAKSEQDNIQSTVIKSILEENGLRIEDI
jgi:mRNA-degrading endonuclease RelE of RelBE toxin-antitoxin system